MGPQHEYGGVAGSVSRRSSEGRGSRAGGGPGGRAAGGVRVGVRTRGGLGDGASPTPLGGCDDEDNDGFRAATGGSKQVLKQVEGKLNGRVDDILYHVSAIVLIVIKNVTFSCTGTSDTFLDDASFVDAVRLHGRDFKSICRHLGMRGINASKHHYYKNRVRLGLDAIMAEREAAPRGDGSAELVEDMETDENALDESTEPSLRHK